MPRNGNRSDKNRQPAFSVQDEIRRNRRLRRAERVRKARTQASLFFTVLLCLSICILLIAAVLITVTRIQTVHISGNIRYSSAEILEAAALEGEVLPLVGEKTVYRRVSEICPYVDSVELIKEYPSTITVNVIETEAIYALRTRERTLTLDATLRVMDFTDKTEGLVFLILPEIQKAVEGKKIEFTDPDAMGYVEDMLSQFASSGETEWLSELDISDRFAIWGKAGDSAEIIFGDYKNIPEKLAMTNRLLSDAKEEYAKYAYIDVSVLSQASLKLEY